MNLDPGNSVLIPVVLGLVEVFKRLGLPSQWAPLASVVLGLIAGFFYLAPGDPATAVLSGLVVGLAAMGLWSGPKSVARGIRGLKQ